MIELIFTLDYEIYGDGSGSLKELVYEPARRLAALFAARGLRFVTFVEVAELQKIDEYRSDPCIDLVTRQVRELHDEGFEIGLHLHPQWCNAVYTGSGWELDYQEYNLCLLPASRIAQIVDDSIGYLRRTLSDYSFTPLSFRAGNWLFQPSHPASGILHERGIRVDSSVFKGGLQPRHRLDYRPALRNGACWTFGLDANTPDPRGQLWELPVYSEMVPFYSMLTKKRVSLQHRSTTRTSRTSSPWIQRLREFARPFYPLKLDFCRMSIREQTSMLERVRHIDSITPHQLMPIVAIGHTKDLIDFDAVSRLLDYVQSRNIRVSNIVDIYPRLGTTG